MVRVTSTDGLKQHYQVRSRPLEFCLWQNTVWICRQCWNLQCKAVFLLFKTMVKKADRPTVEHDEAQTVRGTTEMGWLYSTSLVSNSDQTLISLASFLSKSSSIAMNDTHESSKWSAWRSPHPATDTNRCLCGSAGSLAPGTCASWVIIHESTCRWVTRG